MSIRCVTGDVAKADIGFTQCHEHLFVREGISGRLNAALCMESSVKAQEELEMYYKQGGRTLVDAQPVGCGRMPRLLLEVAERTGVQIIASTGFHKTIFYPDNHWLRNTPIDDLRDIFIHELTRGMYILCDQDTPVTSINARAGMMKTAMDEDLTDIYTTLHTAASAASVATGAAVQCHIEHAETAQELIDFYADYDHNPNHLILAHMDRHVQSMDLMIHALERGVYLQLDTVGRFKYHSDDAEVQIIKHLVDAGFEDRILLGLDTTRSRLHAYGGDIGLSYILTRFIPHLKNEGFNEKIIHKFFVDNPFEALNINGGMNENSIT
jgi:phosphotriesterase-related protein